MIRVVLALVLSLSAVAHAQEGAETPEDLYRLASERVRAEDWRGFFGLYEPETAEIAEFFGRTPEEAASMSVLDYAVAMVRNEIVGAMFRGKFAAGSIGPFQVDEGGTRATPQVTFAM